MIFCVVALADMLCEGAAADWSAVYLRSSLRSSGVIVGLAYTLYSLVMVARGSQAAGWLPAGPKITCCPASPPWRPWGSPSGWSPTTRRSCSSRSPVSGVGCALVIPTTYSTVGEMTSANPGRAVALVSGIGWVGFVAGPPLIGQIASVTSLRFALTIIPVLTALITGLMIATGAFDGPASG